MTTYEKSNKPLNHFTPTLDTVEPMTDQRAQYLDLLAKTLSFALWPEPLKPMHTSRTGKLLNRALKRFGVTLALLPTGKSGSGKFWPTLAHTMVGLRRLANIRQLCESVDEESIPGSFVECGVWRGGASIYARACLDPERMVVCCDSFQGLPPDPSEPDCFRYDFLKIPLETVRANFEAYGLNQNVRFVPGWFQDTLESVEAPIAILRADGDMYSSTMTILGRLYDKVSESGYVIIDDYHLPMCRRAVDHFLELKHIDARIHDIDGAGVWWRKET